MFLSLCMWWRCQSILVYSVQIQTAARLPCLSAVCNNSTNTGVWMRSSLLLLCFSERRVCKHSPRGRKEKELVRQSLWSGVCTKTLSDSQRMKTELWQSVGGRGEIWKSNETGKGSCHTAKIIKKGMRLKGLEWRDFICPTSIFTRMKKQPP